MLAVKAMLPAGDLGHPAEGLIPALIRDQSVDALNLFDDTELKDGELS